MLTKSNQIGEQTVQTDGRGGDCGRGEGAKQPGVKTASGGLAVDQFVHRRDACERLLRIQLANRRAKRRRDRGRFPGGANDDGHRPRVLRERLIGLGAHRLIDAGPSDRKAPSSQVLKRRAAVWLSINSFIGATRARGCSGSNSRTAARSAGAIAAGSPAVRMTTVIDRESCVNG